MKKTISRFAALCLALMVAFSCVPVLGAQVAYADDLNKGTVNIDLYDGFAYFRDSRLHAAKNTFAVLAEKGKIGSGTDEASGDDAYDLDNDGKMDITTIYDPKTTYNPEMVWYHICDTTGLGGKSWGCDVPEDVKEYMTYNDMEYCERIEVNFPEVIRELNIEVKAPACGTETTSPPPDEYGLWDPEKQTNAPDVEVKVDGAYSWMDDLVTFWSTDVGGSEAYIGAMSSEESYLAQIVIYTESGYYIVKDVNVNINGAEFCKKDVLSIGTFVVAAVKPSGDSHTAAAPEITKPTLSSEGAKVYKCKGCGRIIKTEAISNNDLKEAYARGVSAGKSADEDAIKKAYAEGVAAGKAADEDAIKEAYSEGVAAGKAAAKRAAKLTPGKAVIKQVKVGSKKAKFTWKTIKKATGYEICLTNSKTGNVKRYTIKQSSKQAKKKTIGKTIKSLKKGKYKVKVRAMNKVDGETFYGSWSKTKTVIIK